MLCGYMCVFCIFCLYTGWKSGSRVGMVLPRAPKNQIRLCESFNERVMHRQTVSFIVKVDLFRFLYIYRCISKLIRSH